MRSPRSRSSSYDGPEPGPRRLPVGSGATTAALTTGTNTFSWCEDPRLFAIRGLHAPTFVPASVEGVDEEEFDFEMRTSGSSDASIAPGWQEWGWSFTRTARGWRLVDQGTG